MGWGVGWGGALSDHCIARIERDRHMCDGVNLQSRCVAAIPMLCYTLDIELHGGMGWGVGWAKG